MTETKDTELKNGSTNEPPLSSNSNSSKTSTDNAAKSSSNNGKVEQAAAGESRSGSRQKSKEVFQQPRGSIFQGKYSQFAQRPDGWKGWSGSVVFHLIFLLALIAILTNIPKGQSGTKLDPGVVVEGEIVVVNSKENKADKPFLEQNDFQNPTENQNQESTDSAAAAAQKNLQELLPDDLPGLDISDSQSETNGRALTGFSTEDMKGLKNGLSANSSIGESKVKFGGLVGKGSRFVFVIDRSGSMAGALMGAAKSELKASLGSLPEHNQFQVIFYNQASIFFRKSGTINRLWFATDVNKRAAYRFISQTPADGATEHYVALADALALEPDVIFLLTDADDALDLREMRELSQKNGGKASINVIAFGRPNVPSQDILPFKGFARRNGGQFVYKSLRSFN